jgi:hypothetical protein
VSAVLLQRDKSLFDGHTKLSHGRTSFWIGHGQTTLQQIEKLFWQLGANEAKLTVIGAWIFGMAIACESTERQNLAQQHGKGVDIRLETVTLAGSNLWSCVSASSTPFVILAVSKDTT